MRTIGLVGGITWHSTIDYYRIINETVNARLGGNTSAKILLSSLNFQQIEALTKQGDWESILVIVGSAAKILQNAGADCMLLCANTMHIIAGQVQAQIDIPLLHVAGAVSRAIEPLKIKRVLLLGTKYTMQSVFYKVHLQQHNIETIVPDAIESERINDSIYNELGKGLLLPATKQMYLGVIEKYVAAGAQGIVLGCTEIPLLITQADCSVPVFDTTLLHATWAVDFALAMNQEY